MTNIKVEYRGDLRCETKHGPSDKVLITDAPKESTGRGESFSPTDLVAVALGSCILSAMAIVANRHGIDISGATATVDKQMANSPVRRIGKLAVNIHMPRSLAERDRQRLEHAANTCPVHESVHPDVHIPIEFSWGKALE